MEYLSQLDLATVVAPGPNSSVFKDDCMFSFDTAFDANGLDICMTCHQAFSRGDINYTQMHSEFFEHKVYLNYKKVLKPSALKDREEQPLKMMKLEIKDEVESDLFDTKCQLYCQQIDKSISLDEPKIPLKIAQVSEAIIKATSNERKQEIKSWTQDIKPCAHALNLVQEPLPEFQLQKCNSCDLKENLWICLHCGNIGCGREQFGGVPGNTHAVKHHEATPSHHIAVKLGSLAADNADVYCYSCDDEIKVPNLGQLLKTFGIDIMSYVKTEKNLTELQIDQNIKWDFNMDGKDGSVLQPVFGKGLTGLKNLGNSCYMASVLQVIFSIKEVEEAFVNEHGMPLDKILGNYQPWKDLETQMYKLGDGLFSGRYSVPDETTTEKVKYQKGIRPSGFKSLIGEGHEEFSTMLQQDASEFWGYLVDQLEKNKVNGKLSNSPLEGLKYVLETKLKCSKCNGVRITKELDEAVSVPISEQISMASDQTHNPTSLSESFALWKCPEELEYQCPKCQSMQVAVKSVGFKTFPEYLVVTPQRVKLENWVPTKVNIPMLVQEELDIHDMLSSGKTIDEEDLPDDNVEKQFEFNVTAMQSLIEMGFPENRIKRALFNTGNSSSESAMNWLFEHMEDADIDDPFVPPSTTGAPEPDSSSVDMMLSMGLDPKLSKKALLVSNGNVEQAIEWVFSHPDDDGEIPSTGSLDGDDMIAKLEASANTDGKYQLRGVICHKGTSSHSGHYVAFVRKNVNGTERWVLFNDEKVVLADDKSMKEIESSGYLYLYRRC